MCRTPGRLRPPLPPCDYDEGRRAINDQLGGNDIARAPQEQPEGLDPHVVEYSDVGDDEIARRRIEAGTRRYEQPHGPLSQRLGGLDASENRYFQGNLERSAAAGKPIDMQDMKRYSFSERDHPLRRIHKMEWYVQKPRGLGVANEMWDAEPLVKAATKVDDAKPRKGVRFGEVQEVTYLVEFDGMVTPRKKKGKGDNKPFRSMRAAEAANAFDARKIVTYDIDSFEARAGRLGDLGKGKSGQYKGKWKVPLQMQDTGAAFPFATREQMVDALNRSGSIRFDGNDFRKLNDSFYAAVKAGDIEMGSTQWKSMGALLGDLGDHQRTGRTLTASTELDWEALFSLADILDATARAT